jgi:hypothetical protein
MHQLERRRVCTPQTHEYMFQYWSPLAVVNVENRLGVLVDHVNQILVLNVLNLGHNMRTMVDFDKVPQVAITIKYLTLGANEIQPSDASSPPLCCSRYSAQSKHKPSKL